MDIFTHRIMSYSDGKLGDTNRLLPVSFEVAHYLKRVPEGHKLVVVYGGMLPGYEEAQYLGWLASLEHANELKMIRRSCSLNGWGCTYYAIPNNWPLPPAQKR